MNLSSVDPRFMAQALILAERGLYSTRPNPRVGCVLVRDGDIVGRGYHRRAGEPHAEVLALRDAGERARGATAYVTLEPCSHHGRTPPCCEALVRAGVSRVVAAMQDPNPLVQGRGFAYLREQGIAVEAGLLEQQALALNPGFVKRMRMGLPYVRCKLAMSLDGRTAMASGESHWITGPAARRDVHLLRARSEALITGIGTVLADDPQLNVRLTHDELPGLAAEDSVPQPLRVVLDSKLRLPRAARLLSTPGSVLILHDPAVDDSPRHDGGSEVEIAPCPLHNGALDLRAVLRRLAARSINEVMIEAGPTLAGAFLAAGLIDELILYMAPHLMGDGARGLFHLPGLELMEQRLALRVRDIRAVGIDWRICATPVAGSTG